MNISLRMNVDEGNKGYINEMIDILMEEGLGKRVGFYLGQTYPYTEVCQDVTERCLMDKEFSLLGLQTLVRLVKDGFPYTFWMPASRSNFCTADKNNSFVIGLIARDEIPANPEHICLIVPEPSFSVPFHSADEV